MLPNIQTQGSSNISNLTSQQRGSIIQWWLTKLRIFCCPLRSITVWRMISSSWICLYQIWQRRRRKSKKNNFCPRKIFETWAIAGPELGVTRSWLFCQQKMVLVTQGNYIKKVHHLWNSVTKRKIFKFGTRAKFGHCLWLTMGFHIFWLFSSNSK